MLGATPGGGMVFIEPAGVVGGNNDLIAARAEAMAAEEAVLWDLSGRLMGCLTEVQTVRACRAVPVGGWVCGCVVVGWGGGGDKLGWGQSRMRGCGAVGSHSIGHPLEKALNCTAKHQHIWLRQKEQVLIPQKRACEP